MFLDWEDWNFLFYKSNNKDFSILNDCTLPINIIRNWVGKISGINFANPVKTFQFDYIFQGKSKFSFSEFCLGGVFKKEKKGLCGNWTRDLFLTREALCHWACSSLAEEIIDLFPPSCRYMLAQNGCVFLIRRSCFPLFLRRIAKNLVKKISRLSAGKTYVKCCHSFIKVCYIFLIFLANPPI